jgi:hypothetical protein
VIGWHIGDEVFLEPNATYKVVYDFMHRSGQPMPVTDRTLWSRLREAGLLRLAC